MISSRPFVIQFLSTPSARRATFFLICWQNKRTISIHALREEGDATTSATSSALQSFLSTPSARRATLSACCNTFSSSISIHALREEGDTGLRVSDVLELNFYPRPPRGGRQLDTISNNSRLKFLSTPSARRATQQQAQLLQPYNHFYPRPPRGGRLCRLAVTRFHPVFLSTPSARRATPGCAFPMCWSSISIHALREEGDNLILLAITPG